MLDRYLRPALTDALEQKMVFIGGPRQVGKTTLVLRDRKPLFAVECKTGERSVSASARYFAERTDVPAFYQVHRGTRYVQSGKIVVTPFTQWCAEMGMP